jgi:very-short-patch-repair endonuclease
MGTELARAERAIADLASKQHGVITIQMLLDAGMSRKAIVGRANRGFLHKLHRGVYAVGHPAISRRGRFLAAVLACQSIDREAFLSHLSAAVLWDLLPERPGPIDVVLHRYSGRGGRGGIRIHRSETLMGRDVTTLDAIPVTTPARTIWDLSRGPRRRRPSKVDLRRAVRQAGILGYELGPGTEWDGTRSELEFAFLELCRKHRLPTPAVNATVAGLEVDFSWESHRLIVETDGYAFHKGEVAFAEDRRREFELSLHGYEVLRFSYDQVVNEGDRIVTLLRPRLGGLAT